MDFDADWLFPAIFVGVIIVRAVGSRIARAAKKSEPRVSAAPTEHRSPGFGEEQVYRPEAEPDPIEPR